ncbi:MAG: putative lipid II flippase FtsW [Coriobacteriaceae bacterium]|nr:putative lipid II flippase FtsW [Coriobacteriaceae bacterium]
MSRTDETAGSRSERHERSRRSAAAKASLSERLIAGVPARIMRPRLVFLACLAALVLFGLLMVYSASAVEALAEEGSSTYYLFRQVLFAVAGTAAAAFLAHFPAWSLAWYRERGAKLLLALAVALLLLVIVAGAASGGARRWIALGFFTLQPSEFAKPVIILAAADALSQFYERRSLDGWGLLGALVVGVGVPLALILVEPDTGTTLIIAATVVAMALLAGMPYKYLLIAVGVAVLLLVLLVLAEPYRLTRFIVARDPWADPYGTGYQATLAIMAFASGGLTGRGIGGSTMKYSYLPEAHNDYILAIIGEELGFIGMLVFLAVFMLMIYAVFKIARQGAGLYEKLVAAGCGTILGAQFFVNVLGIVGFTPMTGKTLPFISYGGSSMIASFILVGLILRVSRESAAASPYRARRERFAVMGEEELDEESAVSSHLGRSTAGAPRRRGDAASSGFNVYDGGAATRGAGDRPAPSPRPRRTPPAGGWERVDLNADPADRLRERRSGRGSDAGSASRRGRGSRHDR